MAKTIKELAEKILEENKDEIVSIYDRYAGIIDGANYVLEQIEDIIVNNEDNTLNMARCLVDCIEQLKK